MSTRKELTPGEKFLEEADLLRIKTKYMSIHDRIRLKKKASHPQLANFIFSSVGNRYMKLVLHMGTFVAQSIDCDSRSGPRYPKTSVSYIKKEL